MFDLSLFSSEAERANSQKRVLVLLEALVNCNRYWLWQHPETPRIYEANIEYKMPAQVEKEDLPEVSKVREWLKSSNAPADVQSAFGVLSDMCGGGEHFREIPRIIENGGGDCDNVASWRCAELRELGVWAKPYITWRHRADGGTTYHVIVLWPDGTSEDPSLLLGMGGEAKRVEREEEERKLGERTADFIRGCAQQVQMLGGRVPRHLLGQLPSDFGKGIQYTIPFQTDDSYADWSPTRPQAFYAHPLYPNLPTTPGGGPIYNALYRGEDYDWEDRFDGGTMTPTRGLRLRRALMHRRRAA